MLFDPGEAGGDSVPTTARFASYPLNIWLVRRGVKHPMGRPTIPAPAAAAT
jgi:hypothetical protein